MPRDKDAAIGYARYNVGPNYLSAVIHCDKPQSKADAKMAFEVIGWLSKWKQEALDELIRVVTEPPADA